MVLLFVLCRGLAVVLLALANRPVEGGLRPPFSIAPAGPAMCNVLGPCSCSLGLARSSGRRWPSATFSITPAGPALCTVLGTCSCSLGLARLSGRRMAFCHLSQYPLLVLLCVLWWGLALVLLALPGRPVEGGFRLPLSAAPAASALCAVLGPGSSRGRWPSATFFNTPCWFCFVNCGDALLLSVWPCQVVRWKMAFGHLFQ